MMLQAARYGDLEDVRAGLAQGIFVDCQDVQGRTGKQTNKQTNKRLDPKTSHNRNLAKCSAEPETLRVQICNYQVI
jgi:hypothetical protein